MRNTLKVEPLSTKTFANQEFVKVCQKTKTDLPLALGVNEDNEDKVLLLLTIM